MLSPYHGEFKTNLECLVASKYFGREFSALSEAERSDLANHVDGRYLAFRVAMLPWLLRHCDLSGAKVVEVGSGSGASTHAILSEAMHVDCFEIHDAAVDIAEYRLSCAGFTNYTLHRRPFDHEVATSLGEVDGVLLSAVLEHTTFDECISILRDSWHALRPGGWLCVIDTPNRLCPFDHHTSLLPFFSMLPAEVRMEYASRSPRTDFASSFAERQESKATTLESLARWGSGISYHEFEIALGSDVHQHVCATGYEQEIVDLIGITPEDTIAQHMLSLYAIHVNRAFSRRALYMILRKPG